MGIGASVAAVALGAPIIEKHFTLSRADGGVDSTFSLEPSELKDLVVETHRAWQSLGSISYGPTQDELSSLQFRRSIYVSSDIEIGYVFSCENLRVVRPGFGASPQLLDQIIGVKSPKALKAGTPLSLDNLFNS